MVEKMVEKIIEEVKSEIIDILDNLGAPHASVSYVENECADRVRIKLEECGIGLGEMIEDELVYVYILDKIISQLCEICRCV